MDRRWTNTGRGWTVMTGLTRDRTRFTDSGIEGGPAYAWWVDYTLKKRDHIISAVKQHVIKKTHKFGIHVPNNLVEAHALNKVNGNTLWGDAITKEMKNIRVAFDIKEGDEKTPAGVWCQGRVSALF
jgi:hypothetical protein